MLLDEALPRWYQRVVDVENFLSHAHTSDDGVAIQECEVGQPALAEFRRVHRRVKWVHFARSIQIEIHDEKLASSVQCGKLITVRIELDSLDGGFFRIGLVGWRVFV